LRLRELPGYASVAGITVSMQINIDKRSEVPVRDQLRQQIIFLIGTGQLSIGMELPSVRQLARQLKLHHNTISHSYSQLTRDGWLVKKPGSRLVVGQATKSRIEDFTDLDDLIDKGIRLASSRGYSLQQLAAHVRARLLTGPSDHLLLVAPERGLAELIRAEIAEVVGFEPEACSVSLLQQNPSIASGAILIVPSHFAGKVQPAVPADRIVIPISYSPADEHIAVIRKLSRPSVIGVVSVSAVFLETANGLLAPAIGRRHSFREFLLQKPAHDTGQLKIADYIPNKQSLELSDTWRLPDERFRDTFRLSQIRRSPARKPSSSGDLKSFDLLFCDSVGCAAVRHRKSVKYHLISEQSLAEIENIATAIQPKSSK
jgi:DNA-binding transcriptional regulator YhcF (GntR family)